MRELPKSFMMFVGVVREFIRVTRAYHPARTSISY